MKLPTNITKQKWSYCEGDDELFSSLCRGNLADFINFFVECTENEEWCIRHASFIRQSAAFFGLLLKNGELALLPAQTVRDAIHAHDKTLLPLLDKDLAVRCRERTFSFPPVLFFSISGVFYDLRHEEEIRLDELPPRDFEDVAEFIESGDVLALWREEKEVLFSILKTAIKWELEGLVRIVQQTLKRYIEPANVETMLLFSHQESLSILAGYCRDAIKEMDIGSYVHEREKERLAFEFVRFSDEALNLHNKLKEVITDLIYGGMLSRDERFVKTMQDTPHLIGVNISGTLQEGRVDLIPDVIRDLNIGMCSWLTASHIRAFADKLPRIEQLGLRSNIHLEYNAFGNLQHFKKLKGLDLSLCKQIDDVLFQLIYQAAGRALRWNLEGCTAISDAVFSRFGRAHLKITHLNVARCNLSDHEAIDIAVHCTSLRELNLTLCKAISPKGIEEVVANAPSLERLFVKGCGLSKELAADLKKRYYQLQLHF